MLLMGEAASQRDLGQTQGLVGKQRPGALYAQIEHVLIRRDAAGRLEKPHEILGAAAAQLRQLVEAYIAIDIGINEFANACHLPTTEQVRLPCSACGS